MISISLIQRTLILGLCVIPQISLGAVDLTGGIWISRERKVDEATPSSVAGVENPVETNIHTFVTPLNE